MTPRVDIGLQALAVAMKAKCGQLAASDVDELRERAEQLLHRDEPMFRLVTWFASAHMTARGNAEQVAYLGGLLHDKLSEDPDAEAPPERADTHG